MTTRPPLIRFAAVLVSALLVAAACGGDDTDTVAVEPAAAEPVAVEPVEAEQVSAFPVTVPHAFGNTVVEAEPLRVVTWGWGSADAAIALGVIPAAIPFAGYGGDADGVLPWIREAVEATGAEMPTILPDVPPGESPPFEAIAAARPDLILAAYSGISEGDYDRLNDIAPTVAYPELPWATDWRELIEIVGTSLGRPEAAAEVLAGIDARIADAAAAHPEFAGVTVAQVWDTGDTFYVYEPDDARVQFTLDLGFEVAPSVLDLGTDESSFFFTLSHERLGELESDLLIAYADTDEGMTTFLESGPAQLMSQVTDGRVASVVGTEFIASVSPPTALSLVWGLDEYVALLAAALAGDDGAAGALDDGTPAAGAP